MERIARIRIDAVGVEKKLNFSIEIEHIEAPFSFERTKRIGVARCH